MRITKNSLLDLHVFIYTKDSFLSVRQKKKKTICPNFSSFPSPDITRSEGFFWKKHLFLTSVIGDIRYHATHRWKVLEK